MYIKKIMMLLVLVIFILSCTDSTEPEKNSYIKGIVVDSLERPVAGVKIFPEFYFDTPHPGWPSSRVKNDPEPPEPPQEPTTKIIGSNPNPVYAGPVELEFSIGSSEPIDLFITDQNGNLEKKIFEDSVFSNGSHNLYWEGRNDSNKFVENGRYKLRLTSDTISCSHKMFLNNLYDPYTNIEDYDCSIVTDQEGTFKISQNFFPFGDSIQYIDESGAFYYKAGLTRFVKFWAFRLGYQPAYVDSVYVDEQEGCYIQIQLSE